MRKNEAKWIEVRQRWQINIQHDGERRTFISSTPGKKGKIEAERKADKWIESKTKKDVRFSVLWDMFLVEVKATTSASNYKKHEQMGRLWLLPELKHKRLSTITSQDLQSIINKAHKKKLSKKTMMNIRASITAVCKYAAKDKRPFERPFGLEIPKDAPVRPKNIIQPSGLKTLFSINYIKRYNKQEPCFFIHAWRFMVLTGLRRGELCGLKNEDIKEGIVYIKRSVNYLREETRGKNENARRYFALSERAKTEIDAQVVMLKSRGVISPWVFPDESGHRLDPRHLFNKWFTYSHQHNIGCTLHEMRHTLVSVAKSDVPEQLLKRIVGHSKTMDTYGIYGHDVDGDIQRAAKILDKTFDNLLK